MDIADLFPQDDTEKLGFYNQKDVASETDLEVDPLRKKLTLRERLVRWWRSLDKKNQ